MGVIPSVQFLIKKQHSKTTKSLK